MPKLFSVEADMNTQKVVTKPPGAPGLKIFNSFQGLAEDEDDEMPELNPDDFPAVQSVPAPTVGMKPAYVRMPRPSQKERMQMSKQKIMFVMSGKRRRR